MISPDHVARHYDDLDPYYRTLWGEHVHHGLWRSPHEDVNTAVLNLVHLIAASAAIQPGEAVLDIGCGYCATARALVQTYSARVTAVTISRKQYEFALAKGDDPNLQIRHADWNTMEVPGASFDCALAIESSEHMPDQGRFYRKAFDALKPGGRLVVCAWLAATDASKWQKGFLLGPICREGRMPQLLSAPQTRNLALEAGFLIGEYRDLTHQVSPTWSILLGRLTRKLVTDSTYRCFLMNSENRNRVFALTMIRIWLAYKVGAMQYGLFVFERPERTRAKSAAPPCADWVVVA